MPDMSPNDMLEKIRTEISAVNSTELARESGLTARSVQRVRISGYSPNIETLEALYQGLVALKKIRPSKRKPKPTTAAEAR